MAVKVTKKQRKLIEHELRRGTSRSRIAALLDVEYEEGAKLIDAVQESIRPDVKDQIKFEFRDGEMYGIISKLLENSAVVEIYWDLSDRSKEDILETRTIVNFKDIKEFADLPEQPEDKKIIFEYEPEESE